MGLLVDGHWQDKWYESSKDGAFQREQAQRRNWVTPDGQPGPSGEGGFAAEAGRYHLYVSLACPWAHRTLILRKLKGLESLIDVSVVSWLMLENGWTFDKAQGSTGDKLDGFEFMHQRYTADTTDYTGRVTVPVLWDKKLNRIVSNESAEIIRMFNSAFNGLTGNTLDFYPEALRPTIDALNERIYPAVNNGVYRAGFATTQEAYDEAIVPLFETLEWLDGLLTDQKWLVGGVMTEADIRLFTTLIRFDPVYYVHFKCNIKRIADYPGLRAFVQRMMAIPEVEGTVNFEHIKHHYYGSHKHINPSGIVPAGPAVPY